MFTFAAFCYMLSLVLCASLIFFAIWHVSVCIFGLLCVNMLLQDGMHACVCCIRQNCPAPDQRLPDISAMSCITKLWSFDSKWIVTWATALAQTLTWWHQHVRGKSFAHLSWVFPPLYLSLMAKTPFWVVSDGLHPCITVLNPLWATAVLFSGAWPVLMLSCPLCLCTFCKV